MARSKAAVVAAASTGATSTISTGSPARANSARRGPSRGAATRTVQPGRVARCRAYSRMNSGAPSKFKLWVTMTTERGSERTTSARRTGRDACGRRGGGASAA